MGDLYDLKNRLEGLKERTKRCVCKYCGNSVSQENHIQ